MQHAAAAAQSPHAGREGPPCGHSCQQPGSSQRQASAQDQINATILLRLGDPSLFASVSHRIGDFTTKEQLKPSRVQIQYLLCDACLNAM